MAKKKASPPVQPGREDRSLKNRVKDLGAKTLSIKVIVFVIGTGLLIWGKITPQVWLLLAGAVIAGRFAEKKWVGDGRNGDGGNGV